MVSNFLTSTTGLLSSVRGVPSLEQYRTIRTIAYQQHSQAKKDENELARRELQNERNVIHAQYLVIQDVQEWI